MDNSFDNNDFNNFIITEKESQVETEKEFQDFSSIQVDLPTEKSFDEDDYSIKQNFEEEKSYKIKVQDGSSSFQDESRLRPIDMPLVEKKQEVNLSQNQKININARMKLVLASFIVIVTSLLFATVWNFIQINKINSSIAEREQLMSELQFSISNLTGEYNLLDDLEHLESLAREAGYIDADDSNSVHISLDDMYTEETIEKIPSNWFNDVCEFITSLFG